MFTGIVQGSFPIQSIVERPGLVTLTVALPPAMREGLEIGASVAISGVCLTVTGMAADGGVTFDAIEETQRRTTLGRLRQGQRVNVERSARAGVEIGGHELSGHVDAFVMATIPTIERVGGGSVRCMLAEIFLPRREKRRQRDVVSMAEEQERPQ